MSYIASGKPIVIAMDGEVRSLINDTIQCGFSGPAGNARAFYTNLKRLYYSPQKQQIAMGKRRFESFF